MNIYDEAKQLVNQTEQYFPTAQRSKNAVIAEMLNRAISCAGVIGEKTNLAERAKTRIFAEIDNLSLKNSEKYKSARDVLLEVREKLSS